MFMNSLILFVILFYLTFGYVDCAIKSEDVRHHLGTRTPYRFNSNKNDSIIKYPTCKDTKIWMIIRHGTRLPGVKEIKAIADLTALKHEIILSHERGRGEMNKDEVSEIQDWKRAIDATKQKFLTLEGKDEMILLAERMQKRFPNVIKQKYSNKTFLFKYTATQRTQQSARYFTNGLFEKKDGQKVIFAPATKVDPVLRFYKHCNRWQTQVKKNPETYKQQKLYGSSREMNETLESISKRLGLNRVIELDSAVLMYNYCGYETSWEKYHTSPWCHAFDKKTVEVMEYHQDLKAYWLDGYGHQLTYRQACLSIKNMFESFGTKKGPNASFLFTHSGTILKILTYMSLYKPESHLMGDSLRQEREWRTSEIDCFASNLAFVLYRCKDGDYVLTLHQEKIIKLPMCDKELCPLNKLLEYFNDSIADCDFSNMCDLDPILRDSQVKDKQKI